MNLKNRKIERIQNQQRELKGLPEKNKNLILKNVNSISSRTLGMRNNNGIRNDKEILQKVNKIPLRHKKVSGLNLSTSELKKSKSKKLNKRMMYY